MKKLMQVFVSVMIATSTFGGVTNVAAKESTPVDTGLVSQWADT